MADQHKKSFWSTLPGILTGAAALITAITGALALYYSTHGKEPNNSGGRVDYMSRFVGKWVNENIHPSGITRIIVRSEGDNYFVHIWGSCVPTDCDWGEVKAEVSYKENGVLTTYWNSKTPLARVEMLHISEGGRLEAKLLANGKSEFFIRE